MELYFDMAATTPLLPEVQDKMVTAFSAYGNPSSLHRKGMDADTMVEEARKRVGRCLGVSSGRIVFTGSGTEANNLAILGVARQYRHRGRHLVTTAVEHACVLEAHRALEREGFEVTYVTPERDGWVKPESILSALRDDTILVSMMHVNNETGAILPVYEIGMALRAHRKTLFHVDGVQAFGKIASCAGSVRADLYTASGHKIGGPKGVGVLYVRDGMELTPIVYGGGQQFGLRSGTENVPGIVGVGVASDLAVDALQSAYGHVETLRDQWVTGLMELPGCEVVCPAAVSPYIVQCLFPGLRGEVLLHAFESKGLYVSTGSACSSHDSRNIGSHVLEAMGRTKSETTSAIRFSMARWHTEDDVTAAIRIVKEQVTWVRSLLEP